MKSSMRAFGIGLFVAGAAFAAYDQFAPSEEEKDVSAYVEQIEAFEKQVADLQQQLGQPLNEETPKKDETSKVDSENTDDKKQDKEDVNKETTSSDAVKATIYIYENVSLYSIGQQVEDEGIIPNGRELELFLSKPEYARSIQKGTFDLSSDMTIEQIANILTGTNIE